jgi:hypothetical protein
MYLYTFVFFLLNSNRYFIDGKNVMHMSVSIEIMNDSLSIIF